MSKKWLGQTERGAYFLVKLIKWVALRCGRNFTRIFLYPICLYFYCAARSQRTASREYLEKVLHKKVGFKDIAKHFHVFASTLLDRVYFLTNRFEKFDIEIDNKSPLLDYMSRKQGCILLGAHVGSFEIMRALAVSRKNIPIKVLMNKGHNSRITTLLHALNPAVAETLMPMSSIESMLKIKEQIDAGAVIGILGDRVTEGAKSTPVQFLGASASLPVGPLLIASILNAPVIVFYGIYLGRNKYLIKLELLEEDIAPAHATKAERVEQRVKAYANHLELTVRQYPYNWFNYYSFWNKG